MSPVVSDLHTEYHSDLSFLFFLQTLFCVLIVYLGDFLQTYVLLLKKNLLQNEFLIVLLYLFISYCISYLFISFFFFFFFFFFISYCICL